MAILRCFSLLWSKGRKKDGGRLAPDGYEVMIFLPRAESPASRICQNARINDKQRTTQTRTPPLCGEEKGGVAES